MNSDAPITISAGPQIRLYSDTTGCTKYLKGGELDFSEVVDWVNDYINGPWPEGMVVEATPQERMQSIMGYIKRENEACMTSRIKAQIKTDKERKE